MAKLKLVANPTFTAKVGIPVPGDGQEPMHVMMTFKHRTKTQYLDWIGSRAGIPEAESIMDMVSAWEADGLEFNRENVETLLEVYPRAARAILNVYSEQLTGARLGNL